MYEISRNNFYINNYNLFSKERFTIKNKVESRNRLLLERKCNIDLIQRFV